MGWDRCSPEVERGLFAGADPQGSTEDFAAVEDGWAGAQGSTFLARGWAVDPAGAAQGSTEAAGLAPAGRISRKRSQKTFLKFSLETDPSQESLLPINTEHKWEQQLSTSNSQHLSHTLNNNSTSKFWARQRNKQFPSLKLNTNTCSSNKKINLPLFLTLPPQVTIPGWRWPKSQGLFMNSGESEFIKSPKVKGVRYTTLTLGQRNLWDSKGMFSNSFNHTVIL